MKKQDMIASPLYKNTLQAYGVGTLKTQNGQSVPSSQEAIQEAGRLTGQSQNGEPYIVKQKMQRTANRYGMQKKNEIQEGERTSAAW